MGLQVANSHLRVKIVKMGMAKTLQKNKKGKNNEMLRIQKFLMEIKFLNKLQKINYWLILQVGPQRVGRVLVQTNIL